MIRRFYAIGLRSGRVMRQLGGWVICERWTLRLPWWLRRLMPWRYP